MVVKSVPAAELATFQARRDADPAFRALVGGSVARSLPTGALATACCRRAV